MKRSLEKLAYRAENLEFLKQISREEGVRPLPGGLYYKVVESGPEGGKSPGPASIVRVYYKGSLISGKVFDDNLSQGYASAFRLRDLIEGWQIAMSQMVAGDKWIVYIPADKAYGSMKLPGIPGDSTLIFEITLESVA